MFVRVPVPRPFLALLVVLLGACVPLRRPGMLSPAAPPAAAAVDADEAPEATAAEGTPPPTATDALQPACSEVVSGRRAVEALRNPRFLPRVWLADTQLPTLQLEADPSTGRPRAVFRETLHVGDAQLELVGLEVPFGLSVLLVKRMPVGVCVVGSWSTSLHDEARLSLAGRVVEARGGRAALLVRVDGLGAPRFVVLATDGRALWAALGERRRPQMLVAEAELAAVAGAAELTLVVTQRNRYRLDAEGRFAPWSGGRSGSARGLRK